MTNRLFIFVILFLSAFSPSGLEAADWRSVADLRGSWFFTVGDDMAWAKPETNIRDWDRISVPKVWERYYKGYNGFGWYRRSFNVQNPDEIKTLTLFLGYIDDVDQVFINGHKIGQTGKFPPYFETAYDRERIYKVPANILKANGNVICIRIYDESRDGGIVKGDRIGLYYDRDESLLDLNLSGHWKFSTDYEKGYKDGNFDDSHWEQLFVPMQWESQGHPKFDGTAWYRKRFQLTEDLINKDLFLILGKIDDFEKVYLNGRFLGQVEDLPDYSRFRKNDAYKLFRAYRIPTEMLKKKNILAIEIEDVHGDGGIYEGPVGIIDRKKLESLSTKNYDDNWGNGWKSFLNELLRLLD